MMYAIDSKLLENKNIMDFINSTDCVFFFEPEDDIYYISFKRNCDYLELVRLVNELIY